MEAGDLWPLRDPNSVSELELALLHEDEEWSVAHNFRFYADFPFLG